jgi:hypothetical protein
VASLAEVLISAFAPKDSLFGSRRNEDMPFLPTFVVAAAWS